MNIDNRLAAYGTLAPDQPNHHRLSKLRGHWRKGCVKGNLVSKGWAAALGYPAIVLDDTGDRIEVHLFESPDLPAHWSRLDAFEGDEYRRVRVSVDAIGGVVEAWIYIDAYPNV